MRQCVACASLAREVEDLETKIQEAVLVPVPEALAERVLLRHKLRSPARFGVWALAASLIATLATVIQLHHRAADDENRAATVALGNDRPAVTAISYVLDHEPRLLRANLAADPVVMRDALLRLGLKLPENGTKVRYLGKCPVPGGTGEHVVLQTPFGHVTLILVPDRSLGTRVVVNYRNRTAVSSPVSNGSYIVVADSLRTVKRLEHMLM